MTVTSSLTGSPPTRSETATAEVSSSKARRNSSSAEAGSRADSSSGMADLAYYWPPLFPAKRRLVTGRLQARVFPRSREDSLQTLRDHCRRDRRQARPELVQGAVGED